VKVLLVGENATGSCSLLRHLEDRGCHCLFASSGKQAIRLYGEQAPDLVLCTDEAEGIRPLIAFLVGSSASVFRCHPVETGCWWLPVLVRGRVRLLAPALRPSGFAQLLDQMIEEIQSQGNFHGSLCGSEVEACHARLFHISSTGVSGLSERREMKVLICNAGSSSFKFSLFEAEGEQLLAEGSIDWTTKPALLVYRRTGQQEIRERLTLDKHVEASARIVANLVAPPNPVLRSLDELGAVAHRVVHGGSRYTTAVRITPEVKQAIGELADLAPLHNPASLDGIQAVEEVLPEVPQVAVFDTAFHATLPEAARTYAVPRQWTRNWGVRRYGFHGLSHSYCASRAAEMIGRKNLRLITAHLGNGASVSAVRDGICVDTSMGFTPLEGLVMGTRSGTVDPGILIYLLRHKGLDVEKLDHALNSESGLLGISGFSSDMREILAASRDNQDARLAIEVYVHRLRQTVGAMAAILGGVDGLVFAGGVGEHAAQIREWTCENLGYLGLELDTCVNATCKPDADVASAVSAARILVIATNEDLAILRETRRLLSNVGEPAVAPAAKPVAARWS